LLLQWLLLRRLLLLWRRLLLLLRRLLLLREYERVWKSIGEHQRV